MTGAPALVAALRARGESVGCAESLTGGLLCAALVDVPGASEAVRGGVVAYATDLKGRLLGVAPGLLAAEGAVHPDVARAMAEGVCRLLEVTWGVATTGVAGPDPQDGQPPGTVWLAVCGPGGTEVAGHRFAGDRAAVRRQSVDAALALLGGRLGTRPGRPGAGPVPPTCERTDGAAGYRGRGTGPTAAEGGVP